MKETTDNQKAIVTKSTYTVREIQTILRCGRETVYELLKKKEFKWVRIGGQKGAYRISKESFDNWFDNNGE